MPIRSTDLDAGNSDGYQITDDGVSYFIKSGVTVLTNASKVGVYDPTGFDSCRIVNDGTIVAGTGVYMGGLNGHVSNGATGDIHADEGIRLVGTQNSTADNDGEISSAIRGINVEDSGRTTILNTGVISAIYGIEGSNTTECFVDNSGTIVGDFYSIDIVGSTSVRLSNSGQLTGTVWLSASSNATLNNSGMINGDVLFGAGADIFRGKSGTVTGMVQGFGGADKLNAGENGASLSGGAGNDILTGGKGEDAFIFDSAFKASKNVDVIHRFTHGQDLFEFNRAVITNLPEGDLAENAFKIIDGPKSNKGVDHDDRILYDKHDGDLYFDSDGSGTKHARVLFAHLHDGTNLSASDFLVF